MRVGDPGGQIGWVLHSGVWHACCTWASSGRRGRCRGSTCPPCRGCPPHGGLRGGLGRQKDVPLGACVSVCFQCCTSVVSVFWSGEWLVVSGFVSLFHVSKMFVGVWGCGVLFCLCAWTAWLPLFRRDQKLGVCESFSSP
jgi:hypothetical protein